MPPGCRPGAKVNETLVKEMRDKWAKRKETGVTTADLAREYKLSYSATSYILKGISWPKVK